MTQFRPSSFQVLPVIIKNLLIINGLVFLAQLVLGGVQQPTAFQPNVPTLSPKDGVISDLFALHNIVSPLFKPWQLLTHMFMHGSLMHIFGNMFALWMFGSVLENLWGPKRFLTFYLLSGLGAAVCHMIVLYFESRGMINDYQLVIQSGSINDVAAFIRKYYSASVNGPVSMEDVTAVMQANLNTSTVGASGAVFGCLVGFAYLFPNNELFIMPFPFPIKVKWFVTAYIAIELYLGAKASAGDNVAHFAHLGGALVGFLLVYFWNRTNRRHFY